MLERIGDHIQKRAQELGLDRADELASAQRYLDDLYVGQCHALSLNHGVLKVTTANASVANELRFRQVEIVEHLSVKKLIISNRTHNPQVI